MRRHGPVSMLVIVGFGAAVACGCGGSSADEEDAGGSSTYRSVDGGSPHWSRERADEGDDGEIVSPNAWDVRRRRRMDIDQLDAALRRVSGGIGWDRYNGESWFDHLAQTLGKPDYVESTTETLKPNAVFEKFLGDAARSVCRDLAKRERKWSKQGSPEKRRLLIEVDHDDTYESAPEAVDRNLRELLLRFHGRRVALDSETLANWRELFRKANEKADRPSVAWRTVCVTLVQHPDFYTY